MARGTFTSLSALITAGVLAAAGAAQEPGPRDGEPRATLESAIEQVQRAAWEEAIVALKQLVGGLPPNPQDRELRARAHLYLGVAYVGRGEAGLAREHFQKARGLDARLVLDDPSVPEAANEMYRQVAAERAAATPAARVRAGRPGPVATAGLTFGSVAPPGGGAPILHVAAGGPADAAGLRPGDVVVRLDGREVTAPQVAVDALGSGTVGGAVRLEATRDGQRVEATVRPAERQAVLEKACERGDGVSCLGASEALLHAEGVAKDEMRARALMTKAITPLRTACSAGSGYECYRLGRLLADGSAVEKDPTAARDAFRTACAKGIADACAAEIAPR